LEPLILKSIQENLQQIGVLEKVKHHNSGLILLKKKQAMATFEQ
jgi:hypothetical protein